MTLGRRVLLLRDKLFVAPLLMSANCLDCTTSTAAVKSIGSILEVL